jgi:hypothetical protein
MPHALVIGTLAFVAWGSPPPRHHGVPAASADIAFEDRSTVPTYDWTPRRIELRERSPE